MAASKTVLLIGGAGAQGLPIARALSADPEFTNTRILTRDSTSDNAQYLLTLPRVSLALGSSTSELDLRVALNGVTHAFVNTNSFVMGIKEESYWGIRIFELAVQAGVQHFLWSSLDNAYQDSGYDDSVRVVHYEGKTRVAQWMLAQPHKPMQWSVITTGPYMEQLFTVQRPKKREDGVFVFSAPLGDGAIPFIHLEDIGKYVHWIFSHPAESKGLDLKVATEHVSYGYLAKTFTEVTGHPAISEHPSKEEYFTTGPFASERKLGPSGSDDDTLYTVKDNFTRWWRLYQRSADNKGLIRRDYDFLDNILPDRVKTLAEWMRKVDYTGQQKRVLKNDPFASG